MTTSDNARRYFDDLKKVIKLLHSNIEDELSDPFLVFNSSSDSGSPLTRHRSE